MQESEAQESKPAGKSPEPQQKKERSSALDKIGYKILVLSGKGGVGKSTVAANLAIALTGKGRKVGLLDVDVHGPSIPKLMGLEGRQLTSDSNTVIPVSISSNLAVVSIGLALRDENEAVIWRGPMKHGVIKQFLEDVAWGERDFLVIDSPPGTGDEPLSVAQLVGERSGAVLVTTPQDVAVADVRRCVSFCQKIGIPILGVIENMSGFICPHCGNRTEIFRTGGGETLTRQMGLRLLGSLPIDPQVPYCGDTGISFLKHATTSDFAKNFEEIVQKIIDLTG
jgi:Mrp family chromosome partitioning ATPase